MGSELRCIDQHSDIQEIEMKWLVALSTKLGMLFSTEGYPSSCIFLLPAGYPARATSAASDSMLHCVCLVAVGL